MKRRFQDNSVPMMNSHQYCFQPSPPSQSPQFTTSIPPPSIPPDNYSNSYQTTNYMNSIAQSNSPYHGVKQILPQSHPYANNQMTGFVAQQTGNTLSASAAYSYYTQNGSRDSFNISKSIPYQLMNMAQQQKIQMETASTSPFMHLQSSTGNDIGYSMAQPPLPINNLDLPPPPPPPPSALSIMPSKQNRNRSTFKRKLPKQQKPLNGSPPDQLQTIDSIMGSCDAVDSESQENGVTVCKKGKRKPMSVHYTTKEWNREDAIRAVEFEKEMITGRGGPMLILKFPDPELNRDIIKNYANEIENVHFQQPSTPRYCFVSLKDGCDVNAVQQKLSQIPFGTGKIIAERKVNVLDPSYEITPEDIDPYTLYIGNLPTKLSVKKVKEQFPGCVRIDVGFAQRMRYTRYGFIRYDSIEKSIAAFRDACQWNLGPRSVIVRFRRNKGNIGFNAPITQHSMLPGSMETFDDDFDNMSDISTYSQSSETAATKLKSTTTSPTTKADVCKLKPNIQLKPFASLSPANITKLSVPATVEQSTISANRISTTSQISAGIPETISRNIDVSNSQNENEMKPTENGETSTQRSNDKNSISVETNSGILVNCQNAINVILPNDTKQIKTEKIDDNQTISVKTEPHIRIPDCDDLSDAEMDYPGDSYVDSSPDMRNVFNDDISSDDYDEDDDTVQHITEHVDLEYYSSQLNPVKKIKTEGTLSEENQQQCSLKLPPNRPKTVEDDAELNLLFDTLNPDDGFSL